MSTIDSIYSAMISAIATGLPTYTRLSNPYNTSDNADPFLRNGYGVTVGASAQKRATAGTLGFERRFTFVLTNEVFSTENNESAKESAHLALMNDQLTVLKAFELDFSLAGTVLKIEYDSDDGVQFVQNKSEKFIELKTTVSVTYIEAVT